MRLIVAITLSACFAASALGDSAKQPWVWTIQERVAARRDPSLRADRVREATAKADGPERARIARQADMIDGVADARTGMPTAARRGRSRGNVQLS